MQSKPLLHNAHLCVNSNTTWQSSAGRETHRTTKTSVEARKMQRNTVELCDRECCRCSLGYFNHVSLETEQRTSNTVRGITREGEIIDEDNLKYLTSFTGKLLMGTRPESNQMIPPCRRKQREDFL